MDLMVAALFLGFAAAMSRLDMEKWGYRFLSGIVIASLTYTLFFHQHGLDVTLLGFYIFPPLFFYLFGLREGALWLSICSIPLLVVGVRPETFSQAPLTGEFQLRLYASFALLAIPFFILSGLLMGRGGIARRLADFAKVLLGMFPGGLAYVNVLACMFFGAISGSAAAATSAIGGFMIPMMNKEGYDKNFNTAVTVTGATTGLLTNHRR